MRKTLKELGVSFAILLGLWAAFSAFLGFFGYMLTAHRGETFWGAFWFVFQIPFRFLADFIP